MSNLNFKLTTTSLLKDSDPLNAASGKLSTGWDDPNQIEDVGFNSFDGKRIDVLNKEQELTLVPHFAVKFIMAEFKYKTDVTLTLPSRTRNILSGSLASGTAPLLNTIVSGTPDQFQYVLAGDVLTVISGINSIPGTYTVLSKPDDSTLVLSADFLTASSSDVSYSISRTEAQNTVTLRDQEKLFISYLPITSVKFKSLQDSNVIRLLQLG